MKKILNKLTPKTTLSKINFALTIVFVLLLGANHYVQQANAAMNTNTSDCPEGPVPDCSLYESSNTVLFRHPNDPRWFFYCSYGVAYCCECPANLVWNEELDTCDYPPHGTSSADGSMSGVQSISAHSVINCHKVGEGSQRMYAIWTNQAGTQFCCGPGNVRFSCDGLVPCGF